MIANHASAKFKRLSDESEAIESQTTLVVSNLEMAQSPSATPGEVPKEPNEMYE